jgi:hypothetical protein
MHSNNVKPDYNHVINNLQDYMLNVKVLARTFYQQPIENELSRNNCITLKQHQQPQKVQKKEPEKFFYPKEKDQLFWCFYIIHNGFEKYEYPDISSFVNEKNEKFRCIEHLRNNKQQLKIKKIKNLKEDVEDELANKERIGMKTFIALCIAHNINVLYIHRRKCFEIIFDDQSPTHVVHCINNSDSSAYNYCYEHTLEKDQLEKYRNEYFNWHNVEKPLKAISSYKLDDLISFCKKLGLTNNEIDLSKKNKKYLYELLISNL